MVPLAGASRAVELPEHRAHAQRRAYGHRIGVAPRPRRCRRTVQQRADAEPLKRRLAHHVEDGVERNIPELRRHFSVHGDRLIGGLDGDRGWKRSA